MKRFNVLWLMCFAVGVSSVDAQVAFGIKGGLNFASQTFKGVDLDSLEEKSITGVAVGALVEISFGDYFAVQPEVNFLQKGSETVTGVRTGTIEITRSTIKKFSYLDVPILAKLNLGDENFKIYGVAGPTLGFALRGSQEEMTTVNGTSETEESDIDFDTDRLKRFELGGTVGAGLTIYFGTVGVFADGRYLLGFSNTKDNDDEITIKNKGVNANLGIVFKF